MEIQNPEIEVLDYTYSKEHDKLDLAMFNIQAEGIVVAKEADNPHFKSKYADFADIMRKVQPVLTRERLLVNFIPCATHLMVKLTHVDSGQYLEVKYYISPANHSAQAIGSAITYGRRYSLSAILNVVVDGDDDDGNAANGDKKQTPSKQTSKNDGNAASALPELKSTAKNWNGFLLQILNGKLTVEDLLKSCIMSEEDQQKLADQVKKGKPTLKPGNEYWKKAIQILTTDGKSMADVLYRYKISDTDAQDLQADAINEQK